ncbi:hypothetical protein E2C01_090219 [Portunus trituberculatus]|uniref:Uncharacterized protein n=1 Tax=Portunus trituberculatus TaxID=210409 RepID=A0A5B7JPJ0_PORTR|nr:hypothetical protein [Portunus trituberculatus]
MSSLMLCYLI